MKSFLTLFLFIFLLPALLPAQHVEASSSSQQRFDDSDAPAAMMQQVHEVEMRRHALLAKRSSFVPAASEDYDVTYYRLDVTFPSDPTLSFSGNVRMEFRSLADALGEVVLNFGNLGDIDSVLVGGSRLDAASISHAGDVLTLTLPSELQMDEAAAVTMYYSHPYGGSAVMVTNVQNVDLGKSILSIASQAEPYDARNWWPCKDDPADKADSVDILLTVDEPMYPVSNGVVLSDVSNGDGTRTVHWKTRYPIVTYLVSVAAAEYNYRALSFDYQGESMPVGSWWYGMPGTTMKSFEQDMLDGLQVFSDLFIPYPYMEEKYGMAEYEWGGAMEHQTVSSMGFYSTDVVVHELMHQWFGDKVTCATFEHIWLNEGWATYGEALFHEARGGLKALKGNMAGKMYFGPGTIFVDNPEQQPFSRLFSGNLTYNKASWVVHMLRHVVGDEAFFAATKKYLGGLARDNYRSVRTAEFQQYYEDESGMDLDWFFQQWIYGEYYPTYDFTWDVANQGGSYTVDVNIEQLYLSERQLFTMPIDIYVRFSDGSDSTVLVTNNMAMQSYSFTFERDVDFLQLDPDGWIHKQVIEKMDSPTFDRGVLVVNGVDWDVEAYTADLKSAFVDSVFSGGQPYTFWDLFPDPAVGYPPSVPQPVGDGYVPAHVLERYCTVVWIGNAYNGDENIWFNTSIMNYLRAGGNVILVTRIGQEFITEDMRDLLGINWEAFYSTAANCQAKIPSLFSMDFNGAQNLLHLFNATLTREENELLFTETQSFSTERGIGVWGKPMMTEQGLSGHMMYIGLRPYRINNEQFKLNMETLLAQLPCNPVTSVRETAPVSNNMTLEQNYPNPVPAGGSALFRYSLARPATASVALRVYDMLGRLVREREVPSATAGLHSVSLSTAGLPAGVYTCSLEAASSSVSRTMVIIE
ncbi:T9SS type A sorting domain-containing protein [bacterium]|nr:T9SS type A sorting domain-containing protein [bacterium]